MFVLTTIADTVRIAPTMFVHPVLHSVHLEIEKKYPNRVLMDIGLVICRYGDALEIGDGVCVSGDGAAHHEVVFRLVVFRPFVEEVCIGTVVESNEEGIRVSLGEFFENVHIPAYWMLRPSHYDPETSLWVWTPQYDDDDDDDNGQGDDPEENANRFEMYIGAEIRFKVKAINFTQVTNTAKGVQATTTTTSASTNKISPSAPLDNHPSSSTTTSTTHKNNDVTSSSENQMNNNNNNSSSMDNRPVRKRSSSVDLSDANSIPATMHITASICEDGLGLTSWWQSPAEEDEAEEENEEDAEGYNEQTVEYEE